MTIDDLEAFCGCWNRHDIEGLMSFMTDDCVFQSSAGPDACGTRYVGRDAVRQYRMIKELAARYGFDYYGGFTAGPRSMHHIFAAIFDSDDPAQARAAGDLLKTLINDFGAAGYGQYRTHLALMDLAASQYDFNDHALMHMSETIKEALDPNGILSPGKQGIWPKRIKERDR